MTLFDARFNTTQYFGEARKPIDKHCYTIESLRLGLEFRIDLESDFSKISDFTFVIENPKSVSDIPLSDCGRNVYKTTDEQYALKAIFATQLRVPAASFSEIAKSFYGLLEKIESGLPTLKAYHEENKQIQEEVKSHEVKLERLKDESDALNIRARNALKIDI